MAEVTTSTQETLVVDSELNELATLCDKRALTYTLLSRLYQKEIDEAYLAQMKAMHFPAKTGNENADKGYRAIVHFLSNTWPNSIEELALDYVKTFIGHGIDGFSAAYPFESVYTSVKRLTMSDARDEVLAIYRSEGLEKRESWKEGEDHLSLEFEFMQILSNRAARALRNNDEDEAAEILHTQKNFLHDHILRWTSLLTTDMRKFADSELYRGLADLTDGFLEEEKEFLDSIVSDDQDVMK